MLEIRACPSLLLVPLPLHAWNKESDRRKKQGFRCRRRRAGLRKSRCDCQRASVRGIATSGWCVGSHAPSEWGDLFHTGARKSCFLQPRQETTRKNPGQPHFLQFYLSPVVVPV